MILEPALSNGNVIALFSTADASLNISKYDVALFKHGPSGHDLINRRIVVGDVQEGVMNVVEFPKTDRGTYHLEIHPIHPDWKDSCTITMTDTFVIFSGNRAFCALPFAVRFFFNGIVQRKSQCAGFFLII